MIMKSVQVQFNAVSLALLLFAGASDVMADRLEQVSISESPWTFELFIDAWAVKAPAKITMGDTEVELPENLNTILDSLKMTSMLRFDAHKGPLGLFVNPIYYNGTYNHNYKKPPFEGHGYRLDETVWLVDYGMSYEVGRWDIGKNGSSRVISFEPYLGLRFFHDNLTLRIHPEGDQDGLTKRITVKTTSPTIGFKSRVQIKTSWDFLFVGDYGGFDVNNMDNSYQMAGYFNYNFKWGKEKHISSRAYIGYRFLHIGYVDEPSAFEVNVQGPIAGISFLF
jgi:hypothetical protein